MKHSTEDAGQHYCQGSARISAEMTWQQYRAIIGVATDAAAAANVAAAEAGIKTVKSLGQARGNRRLLEPKAIRDSASKRSFPCYRIGWTAVSGPV